MSDRFDTIADAVDALTNPMHVREKYETWHGNNRKTNWHIHTMPSLIAQLETAMIPGEVYAEDAAGHIRRMPSSCPPARLEAINLCLEIADWAANTVWFDCHIPARDDTASNLRALVGAQVNSDTTAAVLAALVRLVHRARVIAGWERPPWRPSAPCPACDQYGLRVRLDLKAAVCVDCRQTWDPSTIGLLAEHVGKTTRQRTVDAQTSAAMIKRR